MAKEGVIIPESLEEMKIRRFSGQCKNCTEVICGQRSCYYWWLHNGINIEKKEKINAG